MDEAQIEIRCPGCGARYWVEREQLGMVAECGNCGHEFTVAEGPAGGAAAAVTVALEGEVGKSGLTISSYLRGRGVTAGGVSLEETRSATDVLQTDSGRKYAVGDVLAKGGMGAILHCRDLNIRRNVAMKVMLDPQLADSPQILRFIEEAQITGQLEHPGIVPVHELGVDTGDNVFYTMKFVHGKTLKDILAALAKGDAATVAAFPLSRLLNVFQRVCEAVAYAHHKHVIHRDLKPENIMVGDFGEVYVMDWGLAKLVGSGEAELPAESRSVVTYARDEFRAESVNTLDGAIMGTPHYMAPEQAEGKVAELDARADIYALGGILYEILALRRAVDGKTLRELLRKVIAGELVVLPADADPAARPHCPNGRIPNSLAAVARKALALAPAGRYATVKDLQAEIEAYQAGFATAAEGAGLVRQLGLLVKRHKAEFALAAAAFVVLVAVVAGFMVKVTKEKNNAVVARNEANSQRSAAEAARVEAENARAAEAERNRELEYENYVNLIANVDGKIKEGALTQAKEMLWTAPQRLRHWEWGYLLRQSDAGILTLQRNSESIRGLAFSPDGKLLATGGDDCHVRVWSVASGSLLWESETQSVCALAFSPDGHQLAVAGYPSIRLLDATTGMPNASLEPAWGTEIPPSVLELSFLPDGKRLVAGCRDGTIRFVEVGSGRETRILRHSQPYLSGLALSPDGRRVASAGGDRMVRMWDVENGEEIWKMDSGATVSPLAFSPDGNTLVTSNFRDVLLLDADTGEQVLSLPGREAGIRSLLFPVDGQYLLGGDSLGGVSIWDVPSAGKLVVLAGHDSDVSRLCVSPDGRVLASSSSDGTVVAWSLERCWDQSNGRDRLGTTSSKYAAALSPDGRRVAMGGMFGSPGEIWDTATGQEVAEFKGHTASVSSIAFSPSGSRVVTASYDGSARVWDAETGKCIASVKTGPPGWPWIGDFLEIE